MFQSDEGQILWTQNRTLDEAFMDARKHNSWRMFYDYLNYYSVELPPKRTLNERCESLIAAGGKLEDRFWESWKKELTTQGVAA